MNKKKIILALPAKMCYTLGMDKAGYTIRRSKDFAASGEYDLTIGNMVYQIYRDTFQFSYPVWYCVQLDNLFEFSKKELIEKILKENKI